MNLSELEVIAAQLLEQQKRHRQLQDELEMTIKDLRDKPKRDQKDKKFHALIGIDWEEPKELEDRAKVLVAEDEEVSKATKEATDKIVQGFSSGDLTVPLDPTPIRTGNGLSFRFRSNASYPKAVQVLSEIIGLPVPLVIDEVTISSDKIQVAEEDPYYAKEKIVDAFDKIRKTVSLKLASSPARTWF